MKYLTHIALLSALLPSIALGQRASPRLSDAVRTLDIGSSIRVAANGQTHVGDFQGTFYDSLSLGARATPLRIQMASIEGLWKRQRYTRRGALIGGLIGGVLGGAFGLAVLEIACETESCHDDKVSAIGLFGALGAGGGALLGAGIGYTVLKWKLVYP